MTKFELPEKPKKTNTSEDFNNLRKAVDELDKFDYTWKTYANKADRRINAANKHIEELERENQSLKADYNNQAESILLMLDEIKSLKSQLQQQALPVVPECVAEWIECVKGKNKNALALLDDDNMPDDVNEWLFFQRNDDNINLILRAWLDGYTVEKPQLFYLKNKLTGLYLACDAEGYLETGRTVAEKFTQQEIDSMQTGSYEKIEVEK